jgi:hypothetical protein
MGIARRLCIAGWLVAACGADDREQARRVAPAVVAAPAVAEPAIDVVIGRSPTLVAAQGVVEETCGGCHRSDLDTAVPEALAVFDLWDPQWLARLDDARLDSLMFRLDDQGIAEADLARVRAAIVEVQARRVDPDCSQS